MFQICLNLWKVFRALSNNWEKDQEATLEWGIWKVLFCSKRISSNICEQGQSLPFNSPGLNHKNLTRLIRLTWKTQLGMYKFHGNQNLLFIYKMKWNFSLNWRMIFEKYFIKYCEISLKWSMKFVHFSWHWWKETKFSE